MTIKEIKKSLPDVKIIQNDTIYTGKLSGRQSQFPKVSIFVECYGWVSWEFSWEAIERAVNNNTYLIV